MTARDRWTRKLSCPTCGKQGEIGLSDPPDHAYMAGYRDIEVDSLTAGFREVPRTELTKSPDVICDDCKVVVNQSYG